MTLSVHPKPEKFRMQEPRMEQRAQSGAFLLASLARAFSGPRMTADEGAPFPFPRTKRGQRGTRVGPIFLSCAKDRVRRKEMKNAYILACVRVTPSSVLDDCPVDTFFLTERKESDENHG